nr:MAG TPA: hypothetical protein [Caudoviricetes sp.]
MNSSVVSHILILGVVKVLDEYFITQRKIGA